MKCFPRLLTLLGLLCLVQNSYGQLFDLAVSPEELEPIILYDQMDTNRTHRQIVDLNFLEEEFPNVSQIQIETFFQKDTDSQILRLGKGILPQGNLMAFTEGIGRTTFLISDSVCAILVTYETTSNLRTKQLDPFARSCQY